MQNQRLSYAISLYLTLVPLDWCFRLYLQLMLFKMWLRAGGHTELGFTLPGPVQVGRSCEAAGDAGQQLASALHLLAVV